MFFPFVSKNIQRVSFFIIADFIFSSISIYIAYILAYVNPNYEHIALMSIVNIFFISAFKGYKIVWRYFSIFETKNLIYALTLSHFVFLLFYIFTFMLSIRVVIISFLICLLSISLNRFAKRIYLEILSNKNKDKNIILIGMSNIAQAIIKDSTKHYNILAIIDDEIGLQHKHVNGVEILKIDKLNDLLESKCEIIITKEFSTSYIDNIFSLARKNQIDDIKIVRANNSNNYTIEDISIEDLLSRNKKDFDKKATREFIKNKTILITGAGGSIGSEIVKQCVKFEASKILLLDHSEFNLYSISEQLFSQGFENYACILKSVSNKNSLKSVFEKYKIDIVIHCAAYKHVTLVQENMQDAIVNNVIGTKNCIDLAIKYNINSFVLISTDKAIRPTSVMGATKRICELYAQNVNSKNTIISSVRFGNVLNSSGSVIPKFKSLIKKNQPLMVTHKEVTRYFMLIQEACELTLQASSLAKSSQVFILDMGEPVKIIDLAKKMLALYKKEHLGIKITGLRDGEKLYEELLKDDGDRQTKYDSIIIAKDTAIDINLLNTQINELLLQTNEDDIKNTIKHILPEFLG